MNQEDQLKISAAARKKADLANKYLGKYFLQSVLAGFYIVVAVILSNVVAAVLMETFPQWGKLLSSFLFAIAIILIVFVGGELFTGNNMTMAIGAYNKKVTWGEAIKVWVMSYLGNFVGCFFLGGIFVASGACRTELTNYYNSFLMNKLELSPMQMFLRAILCNFMVCLAVYVNTRMKTESGKIFVMACVIMAFVAAGFEHCIANMGIFSIGGMILGGLPAGLLAKSFFFVTLGNIVGGAFLLGLPLKLMSTEE